VGILVADAQGHQPAEGRIGELAAVAKFLVVESPKVMAGRCLNGIVFGAVGLHDDLAASLTPACTTCNLGQYLESALGSSIVGQMKRCIRRDHAHQCDKGQIEPFGNHLGADQYIGAVLNKGLQEPLMVRAAGCVTIPADEAGLGVELAYGLFHPLRAQAKVADMAAAALGALVRGWLPAIAVVAD
jgi:hypothetical protein